MTNRDYKGKWSARGMDFSSVITEMVEAIYYTDASFDHALSQ